MRILFDSKLPQYKTPFGTLIPGQECTLNIQIPSTVQTTRVVCHLSYEDGREAQQIGLEFKMKKGPYETWQGKFSLPETGLYFYYFVIHHRSGSFRLFKQGDDTNMEAGDLWQVSCCPADFETPEWARGATIYQLFPDRFNASG